MTTNAQPKRGLGHFLYTFFSGFCMGAADIIPGVSGGTMAFILGVYEDLINGIKSFDLALVKKVITFKFKEVWAHVPWLFLIFLVGGLGTAVLLLSETLEHLLETQEILLYAFFFGLILASVVLLAKRVVWTIPRILSVVAGIVIGYLLVTLTPRDMPNDPLTLLWCGSIAIIAMILPGISGSFLLLILGQYAFVLGSINRLRDGELAAFVDLLPLGIGAVVGLLLFSRVLSWLLSNWHDYTVAILIGFMIGSLRKIWPWREATRWSHYVKDGEEQSKVIADKMVLPEVGMELLYAIGLALTGLLIILILDRIQSWVARATR